MTKDDEAAIEWCLLQADAILAISGTLCSKTEPFNDPFGDINSIASDIIINLQELTKNLAAGRA